MKLKSLLIDNTDIIHLFKRIKKRKNAIVDKTKSSRFTWGVAKKSVISYSVGV
jgi:hypothetical protein